MPRIGERFNSATIQNDPRKDNLHSPAKCG